MGPQQQHRVPQVLLRPGPGANSIVVFEQHAAPPAAEIVLTQSQASV